MSELTHIMVDLETLGTVPGCVILSLGAVEMDLRTYELGEEFYSVISTPDAKENFMSVDADTLKWWSDKPPKAREVLREAEHPDAPPIKKVCVEFNSWLQGIATARDIRLLGNGADFDNPILRVMYSCANVKPYANPFGGRCYRTLKSLDEFLGPQFAFTKLQRVGTYHNALDDAKSQALHLMENLKRLRGEL